ncbi:MAG: hypothetical protein IJF53_02955 [Clostridia bacterium]|nr:hypothetical protein [Clostridia bacterium]
MSEHETMARALMGTPQGMKIIQALDKINAAASTANGRQLISMLAGSGTDVLKSAAAAAAAADRDPARVLISNLLATKEGAALVAKIIEVTGV